MVPIKFLITKILHCQIVQMVCKKHFSINIYGKITREEPAMTASGMEICCLCKAEIGLFFPPSRAHNINKFLPCKLTP